jgi:alpha-1,6-mannosyltransferase
MLRLDCCVSLRAQTERLAAGLSNRRWFVLSQALGYAFLLLLHLWYSQLWLDQGRAFPGLGHEGNFVAQILQFLTLSYLFSIFALSLRYWSRLDLTARELAWSGSILALLAWSSLPANSPDILMYIAYGRIAGVYGSNPYLHPYAEIADSFSSYAWTNLPMPYGPVMLPLLMAAGVLSQLSIVGAIYALKLVSLLVHGGNCWLIYSLLKVWKPNVALYGLFLFGFNPLVLQELLSDGHNDGLMILFGLGAICVLHRGRPSFAVCLALLAGLVKSPGMILWVAILVYLVRQREWRGLSQGLLGSFMVLLTLKWMLFPTFQSVLALTNRGSGVYDSLHVLLIGSASRLSYLWYSRSGRATIRVLDREIFALLFLCFALWRLSRVRDLESLVDEVARVWLGLLIGYAAWFWPWYVTWLVPLAALTESVALRRVITVYSFTVLSLYAFPAYVVERAPLSRMWATLRILLAHLVPLRFAMPFPHLVPHPTQEGKKLSP